MIAAAALVGSWQWQRPGVLVALVLPAALLLLAAWRRARPREQPTGTLRLWQSLEIERAVRGSERARRLPPPAVACAAAALVAVTLALAEPRAVAARAPRHYEFVLDASPSLRLPHGASTRAALAVERASDWFETNAAADDRGAWLVVSGVEVLAEFASADEALAFVLAARGEFAPPQWNAFDAPGRAFVSDRLPEPVHAGVFASGGPAVPGAIGGAPGKRWLWDGERVRESDFPEPPWSLVLAGALPDQLVDLAHAWAAERGLSVVPGPVPGEHDARVLLTVRGADAAAIETPPLHGGRDGWQAHGRGVALSERPGARVWCVDAVGDPAVLVAPGTIECAWSSFDVLAGEPADFADSFAALFDAAALPVADVVALDERAAAGSGRSRPPSARPAAARVSAAPPPAAWLAATAVLLAVLAAVTARDRAMLAPER